MKRLLILLFALLLPGIVLAGGKNIPPGSNSPMTVENGVVSPKDDSWSLSAGLSVPTTISTNTTLDADDIDGGIIPLSGDGTTITLPAVSTLSVTGKFITFYVTDATAKHIDTNAADKITLRGTALDDGDKLSIAASSAGTMITLYYLDATGWVAPVGTSYNATDGGA